MAVISNWEGDGSTVLSAPSSLLDSSADSYTLESYGAAGDKLLGSRTGSGSGPATLTVTTTGTWAPLGSAIAGSGTGTNSGTGLPAAGPGHHPRETGKLRAHRLHRDLTS